jgi:hypothetical protein
VPIYIHEQSAIVVTNQFKFVKVLFKYMPATPALQVNTGVLVTIGKSKNLKAGIVNGSDAIPNPPVTNQLHVV